MSVRSRATAALAVLAAVPLTAQAQSMPSAITIPPPAPLPPYLPFPALPPVALDEANNGVGIAQQTARAKRLQGRILWIDATANLDRINTAEKIAALVAQVQQTGFNTIVLDVKPIVGHTLYPSRFAPKLTAWKGRTLPADFDPVAAFVAHARAAGLTLVANLNTFSEGHRDFKIGPGYDNPGWQTTLYETETRLNAGAPGGAPFPLVLPPAQESANAPAILVYTDLTKLKPAAGAVVVIVDAEGRALAQVEGTALASLSPQLPAGGAALIGVGPAADFLRASAPVGAALAVETVPQFVPISQRPERQVPLMVNPHNRAVQQRLRDMLTELLQNYALDGVIFDDRMRYAGINADFSDDTRREFETYVGRSLRWPDDVFRYEVAFPTLERRVVPGPHYDAWLLWRALTLRNWLASAVATVKQARPKATVSTYTGSWYGEYPALGPNWGADDFRAGFRFLTPAYRQTGFAGLLDWMTTGGYYPTATLAEAAARGRSPGATVEAAGQLTNRAANDQTWAYAGISLDRFYKLPADALKNALQAAAASTQGVMVFDLSHFDESKRAAEFWSVFAEAFRTPAAAPHAVPGLLAQVRREQAARRAAGIPDPPVLIYSGIPGTGL